MNSARDLWVHMRCTDLHAITVLQAKKREKKQKNIIKQIMTETPKFDEKHNLYTPEDQQTPKRITKR